MTADEMYDREFDQRDQLRAAISLPLGIMVVLGGLLATMTRSYHERGSPLDWILLLGLLVAGWLFLRSCYYLIRSYHGHVYKTIPSPGELAAHKESLRSWYRTYDSGHDAADREYMRQLEQRLIAAAEQNSVVNRTKSEFLFRANGALISCAIAMAVTFIPYEVRDHAEPEPVYKVQIVSADTVKAPEVNRARQTDSSNTSAKAGPGHAAKTGNAATKGSARGPNP